MGDGVRAVEIGCVSEPIFGALSSLLPSIPQLILPKSSAVLSSQYPKARMKLPMPLACRIAKNCAELFFLAPLASCCRLMAMKWFLCSKAVRWHRPSLWWISPVWQRRLCQKLIPFLSCSLPQVSFICYCLGYWLGCFDWQKNASIVIFLISPSVMGASLLKLG